MRDTVLETQENAGGQRACRHAAGGSRGCSSAVNLNACGPNLKEPRGWSSACGEWASTCPVQQGPMLLSPSWWKLGPPKGNAGQYRQQHRGGKNLDMAEMREVFTQKQCSQPRGTQSPPRWAKATAAGKGVKHQFSKKRQETAYRHTRCDEIFTSVSSASNYCLVIIARRDQRTGDLQGLNEKWS